MLLFPSLPGRLLAQLAPSLAQLGDARLPGRCGLLLGQPGPLLLGLRLAGLLLVRRWLRVLREHTIQETHRLGVLRAADGLHVIHPSVVQLHTRAKSRP